MRNCRVCGEPIPAERLEALPDTLECVKHSSVPKVVGFMCFDHKTAPTLLVIKEDEQEKLRQANRANRRSR